MREHNARNLRELFARARLQSVFRRVKENIRHVDDQTTRGVACFEDLVELFNKLIPELLFFSLGLFSCLVCSIKFGLCGLSIIRCLLLRQFSFCSGAIRRGLCSLSFIRCLLLRQFSFCAGAIRRGLCSCCIRLSLSPPLSLQALLFFRTNLLFLRHSLLFFRATPLILGKALLVFCLRSRACGAIGFSFCCGFAIGCGLAFPLQPCLILPFERDQARVFCSLHRLPGGRDARLCLFARQVILRLVKRLVGFRK